MKRSWEKLGEATLINMLFDRVSVIALQPSTVQQRIVL